MRLSISLSMTVCYYHVTYEFRVNPHSIVCRNVKELLAGSMRHIWSSNPVTVTKTLDMTPGLSNELLDIQENYREWIHSETRMWYDNNIQSNAPYRKEFTTQLNHLASLVKWLSVRLWSGCGFESCCCCYAPICNNCPNL